MGETSAVMAHPCWIDVLESRGDYCVQLDDALDLVRRMPAASVDAIVTDPPYASVEGGSSALVKRVGGAGSVGLSDTQFFQAWLDLHFAEWSRVLSPTGAIWLSSDLRGIQCVERSAARVGMKAPAVGVWDRERVGMGWLLRKSHEFFVVVTKPKFERLSASEVDVWRHAWGPSDRKSWHPAEKPVDLMRRAVRLVSCRGSIVLDPFAGSGSTGVATVMEGRRFVGCERDPDWAVSARERIHAAKSQLRLPGVDERHDGRA